MRKFIFIAVLTIGGILYSSLSYACDACKIQQPKITQGITHGTGPESSWDWVIVAVMGGITLLSLVYALKYLIKPGEKDPHHIKQSILES